MTLKAYVCYYSLMFDVTYRTSLSGVSFGTLLQGHHLQIYQSCSKPFLWPFSFFSRFSLAPSNAIRFGFGPSNFFTQINRMYGSLLVGFIINDIPSGCIMKLYFLRLLWSLCWLMSKVSLDCRVCLRSGQSFKVYGSFILVWFGLLCLYSQSLWWQFFRLDVIPYCSMQFYISLCCKSGGILVLFSSFLTDGKGKR